MPVMVELRRMPITGRVALAADYLVGLIAELGLVNIVMTGFASL
jgi:hypothetical protein